MTHQKVGTMPVQNGRYVDHEGRSYQRVTNRLKHIETDTYHLDEWRANTLAVGLAGRPDLVLSVQSAAQYGEDGKLTAEAKKTLSGLRHQAMDAARSRAGSNAGTALHNATDRFDLGETVEQISLPYPWNASLNAYATVKRALGLEFDPRMIERTVRLKEWGVAGSFDRFGTSRVLEEMGILQEGELIVVDTKTERDPTMNGIHIGGQLAHYAHADDIWTPTGFEPMPLVNRNVGLVMHVRDGRCTPYFVNLVQGWEAAQAAHAQGERLKRAKEWLRPVPVQLPPATALVQERAEAELRAARERLTLTERPAAAVEVAVRRPDGMTEWVPQNVDDMRTQLMVLQAIDACDTMEALADTYARVTAGGVPWAGEVQRAGEIRAAIVQCPQRELHTENTIRDACGWRQGLRP